MNPALMPPDYLDNMKGLVAGSSFVCAYGDSEISCWGSPYEGKLDPPKVVGQILSITAGGEHACFRDLEKVKC